MFQGNKRTPPRFVGREAIVTTQCLNGWLVSSPLSLTYIFVFRYHSICFMESAHFQFLFFNLKKTLKLRYLEILRNQNNVIGLSVINDNGNGILSVAHRYVVKTLDNAESVKLQYRSLAKVQDSQPSNLASSKITTPNWL